MEEPSVDEGQQPVGDALAQPPPGSPKTPPLAPLPRERSELPEHGPRQEQQQGWGQAWGGHGGSRRGSALGGCWVGTQVSEGDSWEALGVWGRHPARSRRGRDGTPAQRDSGGGFGRIWGPGGSRAGVLGGFKGCPGYGLGLGVLVSGAQVSGEGPRSLGGRDTGFGRGVLAGWGGSHHREGSSPTPSAAPRGRRGVARAPTSPLPAAPALWPWGLWGDLGEERGFAGVPDLSILGGLGIPALGVSPATRGSRGSRLKRLLWVVAPWKIHNPRAGGEGEGDVKTAPRPPRAPH